MILNKHTRQGDKNVLLLCLSFCVVLNNLLQCHRRIINLLKLEVKIWRSLKVKEKRFLQRLLVLYGDVNEDYIEKTKTAPRVKSF